MNNNKDIIEKLETEDTVINDERSDTRTCIYDKITISQKGLSIFISVISIVLIVSLILFITLK